MRHKQLTTLLLITLLSPLLFAEIDVQTKIYDAAEEMIQFDEKMNQAIIKHNQINPQDADEMRLEAMAINDFTETPSGYILERTIDKANETEVKVEIQDEVLIISTKTLNKDFINHELNNTEITTMSSMSVSLLIPNDADKSKMVKNYEHGILTITFPRETHNN